MTRQDAIGGLLITVLLGFITTMGALAYYLSSSVPADPDTLCPVDRAVAHTVIVADRTDELTEEHVRLLTQAVEREAAALPVNGRLSIFVINGKPHTRRDRGH